MIYELRIYETIPGRLPALNDRFANHTVGFFEKHGIHVVGFWTEEIGTSNQLVYMLGFDQPGRPGAEMGRFPSRPGLAPSAAPQSETDGPINARVRNVILRPTSYSPMQ